MVSSIEIIVNKNVYVHLRLRFMNINKLRVQWWESERRILVWLGPGKHKNANSRFNRSCMLYSSCV